MPIVVRCACGVKLKAKDELAGKTLKCPKCKQPLLIPAAEEDGYAVAEDPATSPPAQRPSPVVARPASPATKVKKRPPPKDNRMLLIAAIGGGALALVLVVGLIAMFLFSGGDQVAQGDSSDAATTAKDGTDNPDPAGSNDEQNDADLIAELRNVVTKMLKEADTGFSAKKISALADARARNGIEDIRQVYPEFLTATNRGGPELAKERIDLVRKLRARLNNIFRSSVAAGRSQWKGYHSTFSPVVAWLLKKHAAGSLDPSRTELLGQLMAGHFKQVTSTPGKFKDRDRERLEANKERLFPGAAPSEPLAPKNDEESAYVDQVRTIMLGMHKFRDVYRALPGVDQRKRGEPRGLSWRVHVLPYISEESLYGEFRLDEPWDSESNRKLVTQMPDIYRTPGVAEPGMTSIHVFVGEETPFGGEQPPDLSDIEDGTEYTFGCVVAGPGLAAEWTRPGGIELDRSAGASQLGTPQLKRGFPVGFLSTSSTFLSPDTPAGLFSRFVTHQDGSRISLNDLLANTDRPGEPLWPFGDRERFDSPVVKLKHIGYAMSGYHRSNTTFPSASANAAGQSGLSWRVHILPYIDEESLYKQFKLDQPWDSPHNIKLLDQIPDVYRVRGIDKPKTVFHVFVGENTPFGQEKGPRLNQIVDGAENTLLAVMGTPETAVEWTKPGGISFDPSQPFRGLADLNGNYAVALMDGSAGLLSARTSPQNMASLITHRDGQQVKPAFLPRE